MGVPTTCRIGYGLMNFTWRPSQTPDEQAFKAIKTAVDAGCSYINSAEFYGQPDPEMGLKLLGRFYKANPEYVDKTYLSVKGGLYDMKPDVSPEGLRKSVTTINKLLGTKKMDMFEIARLDPKVPIEDVLSTLKTLREEGHFKDIGLSEVSATTIKKAVKITEIAAVEVEYSPWSTDIEQNGILSTCEELNIPIMAYSPLGRGFLDPKLKSLDDIPEGDFRRYFPRFQPGNFEKNLDLAHKIRELAEKKGCTAVQLGLAWEMAQSKVIHPIPGSTRPEGILEAIKATSVKLTEAELKEIRHLVDNADVGGDRYPEQAQSTLTV